VSKIYIPIALRLIVIKRASERCEYCQSPASYSPEIFEVEHIQPISAGGVTELSNLALACPACNRYKGSYQSVTDPETDQVVLLFNPRLHDWLDHFIWSDDLTTIESLTSIGRVTIVTLHMNRPAVQHFRAALQAIGQHPAQFDTYP